MTLRTLRLLDPQINLTMMRVWGLGFRVLCVCLCVMLHRRQSTETAGCVTLSGFAVKIWSSLRFRVYGLAFRV